MDETSRLNLVHIVRPAHADRGTERHEVAPGVLLLHGRGADETDLMAVEEALDHRLVVVSARAPFRLGAGFAWYDMPQVGKPEQETFDISLEQLREFIDDLPAAYQIDPERLYLLGFSQGAIMSAGLALVVPEKIRGVIMHSGYVPTNAVGDVVPGGIANKGFFVAHGVYDEVIPITYGRETQGYLSSQSARLTYNEYPIGHGISEESLYDLSEWLSRELER